MERKRFLLATVVIFLVLFVAGYLIHETWLGPTYRAMRADGFSFRPLDSMFRKFWILVLSDFLYAALFVWIYVRGREDKPWVIQGLRYGVIMTLFTIVPPTLNDYLVYFLPYSLAIKWLVSGFAAMLVMGLVVAAMCQKRLS